MQRLPRNALRFDPVELFSSVSRDLDYKIEADSDHEDFLAKIAESLRASVKNPNMLHGKRIEAMFSRVAGALGRCKFIKQEDSGSMFYEGKNLQAPDYLLILNDGRRFMVEVKNFYSSGPKDKFYLKKDYVERLENYADLHGAELKFAIYFTQWNRWVLLSKQSLQCKGNKFFTTLLHAFPMSEMIELGDRMIGTTPNLTIELIASKDVPAFITEDSQASFTVGDVKMYCDETEIETTLEKNIAFYLVRFGRWTTGVPVGITHDDELYSVKFDFHPEPEWDESQGFAIVGELSSMVSTAYNEMTTYQNRVVALDAKADPSIFKVDIPEDYKGKHLPLWQLMLQPNDRCLDYNPDEARP